jgi:hypothetical protein
MLAIDYIPQFIRQTRHMAGASATGGDAEALRTTAVRPVADRNDASGGGLGEWTASQFAAYSWGSDTPEAYNYAFANRAKFLHVDNDA